MEKAIAILAAGIGNRYGGFKQMDPIAYRCGMSDIQVYTIVYVCPICEDEYEDVAGFCKSATLDEIEKHGFVLTPGRYVGVADVEDDGEPFPEKMARLAKELDGYFSESARLEKAIRENMKVLEYELG